MPGLTPPLAHTATAAAPAGRRGLLAGYGGLCALCWLLYAVAGTDWQRGTERFWDGAYEATWNLGPPILLGLAALPWASSLQRSAPARLAALAWHTLGALVFIAAWQATQLLAALYFFGAAHASATFEQRVLWQAVWGVFVYLALMAGFGGSLHAQRAQTAALAAARAEAALVRAELAAISGKLNPHFLFNTLNSLLLLTRKDPAAAEQGLLRFAGMMRYVLDSSRGAGDRVPLRDELAFVRDCLALEALRLGPRLRVQWDIDPAVEDDEIPPLTLQPLVENAIVHGIAPQLGGGLLTLQAHREGRALRLRVQDDGAGCAWPPAAIAGSGSGSGAGGGVGLSALQRRFELDYDGSARLSVRSAPGAGFAVEILIPQRDTGT